MLLNFNEQQKMMEKKMRVQKGPSHWEVVVQVINFVTITMVASKNSKDQFVIACWSAMTASDDQAEIGRLCTVVRLYGGRGYIKARVKIKIDLTNVHGRVTVTYIYFFRNVFF